MTPEKKAERLVRKDFYSSKDIPESLKKRQFHRTQKGDFWIYEVGERGIIVRYFVKQEQESILLRRVITRFQEEKHPI